MGRYDRNSDQNWLDDPGEEELTDEQFYEGLASRGVKPEELVDPEEKAGYIKFLETYGPKDYMDPEGTVEFKGPPLPDME